MNYASQIIINIVSFLEEKNGGAIVMTLVGSGNFLCKGPLVEKPSEDINFKL